MSLINTDQEITQAIEQAQIKHNPKHWFIAYSGGSDSAVTLQSLLETGLYEQYNMQTMTIDTELSSKGHLDRVAKEVEQATGDPVKIYKGDGLAWYVDNVRKYGFGYRIMHHAPYYQYLKRKAIEACIRENKEHRMDRIAFITGVRRSESRFRAKRPILQRSGARVTVNAIATLNDDDKKRLVDNSIEEVLTSLDQKS